MTGVAVLVLSLAAALYTWYQTLSLSARNQDGPWFSIMLGVLVMLGGIMLAIGVETWEDAVGKVKRKLDSKIEGKVPPVEAKEPGKDDEETGVVPAETEEKK